MSSVTGTVSSTVVTLSRNAENTAVTIDIMRRMPQGRASTFFADQIATYWNRPERRVMLTISIIPSRRPSVFQSTARIASSWFSTPTRIRSPAPSSATIARLSLSLMMTRYVTTKSVVATHSGDRPKITVERVPGAAVRHLPSPGWSAVRRSRADTMPTSRPLSRSTTGTLLAPLCSSSTISSGGVSG